VLLAPGEEFRNRAAIGSSRVRVANVGDEEFPKARLRALAGGADNGGHTASDGNDLVHRAVTTGLKHVIWQAASVGMTSHAFDVRLSNRHPPPLGLFILISDRVQNENFSLFCGVVFSVIKFSRSPVRSGPFDPTLSAEKAKLCWVRPPIH
jgi:hypothetical protein